MKKLKSKSFCRYLLSYTIVLCLPILVLVVTCGQILNEQYTSMLIEKNTAYLQQLSDTFDAQLEQLMRVGYLVQGDSDLSVTRIGDDVIAARSASAKLLTYQSVAVIPSFLYIYRSGMPYAYTSGGRMTPEKLFTEQYVYANHTVDDFYHAIEEKENIVIWGQDTVRQFGGNAEECLTVFISVKGGSAHPKQRTVFLIPTNRIPLAGLSEDSTILLYSPDGTNLLSKGAYRKSAENVFALLNKAETTRQIEIDHEEIYASHIRSTVTGWDYVVLTPTLALRRSVNSVVQKLMFSLISVLLLGGAVVYFVSVKQYKPFQKIMSKVRVLSNDSNLTESMAAVEATLDHFAQQQNEYRILWDSNREKRIHDALSHLLLNSSDETAKYIDALQELGLTLDSSTKYVIIDILPSITPDEEWDKAVQKALMLPAIGFEESIIFRSHPTAPQLVLILTITNEGNLDNCLEQLQSILEQNLNAAIAFGVSRPMTPLHLNLAYAQAEQALCSRLTMGEHVIAYYNDATENQLPPYPKKELEQLQWYLLQLDNSGALQTLNALSELLKNNMYSVNLARMICFDIINTIYKCFYTLADSEHMQTLSRNCDDLADFSTVNELYEMLQTMIPSSLALLSELRNNTRDPRLEEMESFIASQCLSCDFSINLPAEHFGISVSNLSRFFKSGTGKTVSEYVQELRLHEACRLLHDTTISIQVIGEMIGMPNASSFIRFFKQQKGMPPGRYRELYMLDNPPTIEEQSTDF